MSALRWISQRKWSVGVGVLVAILVLTVLAAAQPSVNASPVNAAREAVTPTSPVLAASSHPASVSPSSGTPGLTLGISAYPQALCAYNQINCAAGVGESKVTMVAQASPNGIESWPAVQVAFVIETTAYDGVYDPGAGDPGLDSCAGATGAVCEESNGVCFFVTHAQQIANAIQDANPHSVVSFALVDYFATLDSFDDGDGAEYHVDIPSFVGANSFGPAVAGTFQAQVLGGGCIYSDSDLSDNILHSSSITALFGTIVGSGLNWGANTHHVIVWMGSTAPRAVGYSVNYAVSPSDYADYGGTMSPTCEPPYSYGSYQSPPCEGWVRSQDGNVTHSIAGLAKSAAQCTDSIGRVCTIDMIDLYNGVTDPWSKAWPAGVRGGGPGGVIVEQDVEKILDAGCDLSAATGGTWDGPNFWSCPDGVQGSLQFDGIGSSSNPNTNNPTLYAAFRQIGFGPIQTTLVANGTKVPLFQFVPFGNVRVAPNPQFQTRCTLQSGVLFNGPGNCVSNPVVINGSNGLQYYGWNWSANSSRNTMYVGDTWSVSFWIVVNGPPYRTVPADACVTFMCKVEGSQAVQGVYTSATYLPVTNNSAVTASFPVAMVTVEVAPPVAAPITAPPAPPIIPPGIPIATGPAVPVVQPIPLSAQVGVGNIALQATAAGWIAAGFMRVSVKNRPISMAVAALSGKKVSSKFDAALSSSSAPSIGRFE